MFKQILVPTDGSDISIAGALRAVPLARLAGARMTVVFVLDTYRYSGIGEANAAGMRAYMEAAHAHGADAVERIIEAAKAAGVAVDSRVVEDHQAARGIVDTAKWCGADLIVMGSHGRSGLSSMMMGSVTAKVLATSAVPVMVIK